MLSLDAAHFVKISSFFTRLGIKQKKTTLFIGDLPAVTKKVSCRIGWYAFSLFCLMYYFTFKINIHEVMPGVRYPNNSFPGQARAQLQVHQKFTTGDSGITPDVPHNTRVTFTFWTLYVSFVFITRIRFKRNNKCKHWTLCFNTNCISYKCDQ